MSVSQVTWQDLQQAPDDGKRREAIGSETVGEADLETVFRRG